MEVDPFQLTECYILNLTGSKKLGQIRELNLKNHDLLAVEAHLLERLSILESLDLSNNKLTTFPTPVTLRNLQFLDVTNNCLTCAQFATQFPNLQTLNITGNNITQADKHIVAEACSKLVTVDGHKVDSLRNLNDRIKEKLQSQLDVLWEDDYSDTYHAGIPIGAVNGITQELITKVKDTQTSENNLAKARDFLLERLAQQMVCEIQTGQYSPRKKHKLVKVPSIKPIMLPKSPKKTPVKKREQTSSKLADIGDYDPVHFIRCHFGDREATKQGCSDDDPKDEFTKVWQCRLEPDPHNPDKDTGLVATCGGQTVCLIDYSTGKVMKRYRHSGEQFYSLAWTTVNIQSDNGKHPTNILAVGGFDACIKLLHPDQLVCYKEWGTGTPNKTVRGGCYYMSDMVFHPKHKTWLFAGASDTTVTLWDIGVPSGPKHQTTERRLMIFTSEEEVLRLVISVQTDHLVAGCGNSIVAWSLPKEDMQTSKRKATRKYPSVTLEVPCHHVEVDGMTLITDNLVASKCVGEGTIFIWRLTDCLKKNQASTADISPLATLQWRKTSQEFINLGAGHGIVACGDEIGNIWLYNIQSWLYSKKQSTDTIYAPSRILEWPECDIDDKRTQEKQMTDLLDKPEPLIINDISVSKSGEYIIAGTDNNLICVWKSKSRR